jgi:predicted amino acid dehydrogenase
MDKFGFIVHPVDINQIRRYRRNVSWLPDFVLKFGLKHIPPYVISEIKHVRSLTGREISGYFIGCPLLPKQMIKLNEKFVLDRIIQAGRIAQDLGVKIVGLGGYTSVVGDKGETIAKNLRIPVTTGNSYTVALVIEGVLEASRKMNINLARAKAAIIGATGSIGQACTRILSRHVPEIVIKARHLDKLQALQGMIQQSSPCKIKIEDDVHLAVRDADIVVATTSAPEALIDAKELKPGSVVCDVSVPKNISGRTSGRKDVFIFDGGLATYLGNIDFGANTELPEGQIYGCIAETMILALEGRFESLSLGNNLSLEKISEVRQLGEKHGFGLALN